MTKNRKGFTLIELILVVVLLAIVSLALASAFLPTMQVSATVDTRKEALQNTRLAMERMMREIREARSITTYQGNRLVFTNAANQSIDYSWTTTLCTAASLNPLTRNGNNLTCNCVCSLNLTYLNKTSGAPASASDIWRIQADLQVKVGSEIVEFRSEVNPKNIY